MKKKTKRFSASINVYIYAESDEEAKKQAENLARELDAKKDNKAKVISIGENAFGSTEYRELK